MVLAAAPVAAASPAGGSDPQDESGWSEAESATVLAYVEAFNARDVDAIMSLYADAEPALPSDSRFVYSQLFAQDVGLSVDLESNGGHAHRR